MLWIASRIIKGYYVSLLEYRLLRREEDRRHGNADLRGQLK